MRVKQQRGVALLLVLTMLSILIGISANYILAVSRETESIDIVNSRTQARYSAFAGVAYAQFAMQDSDKELRWSTDGKLFSAAFAEGMFYVRILPESGRIDINNAGMELLALLFEYAGLDEEQAKQVAINVLHWRSINDISSDGSVSDADYESVGKTLPLHRPFYVVEEFAQVLGVDLPVYNKIKSLITVYGNSRVNGIAASPEMLKVLKLTDENIEAIRVAYVDYLENETPFPPELQQLSPLLTFQLHDNYYRVLSYAVAENGTSEAVYSIISGRLNRNGDFQIKQTGFLNAEERKRFIQLVNAMKEQKG